AEPVALAGVGDVSEGAGVDQDLAVAESSREAERVGMTVAAGPFANAGTECLCLFFDTTAYLG
ncbi:MAG: hypothetical protein ND866_23550, partial [Pyrinomonadaceae bacterium]|nr:hypothetical protein [Pyrinomonadaceae bacterium]